MKVTQVKIKSLIPTGAVACYASIVLDEVLKIEDLRLVRHGGAFVVAMPDRKMTDRCPECGKKNAVFDLYCGRCGNPRGEARQALQHDGSPLLDSRGRPKTRQDLVYPLDYSLRRAITEAVVSAYFYAKKGTHAAV